PAARLTYWSQPVHSFFRPAVFFLTLTMSLNAFSERKASDRITQDIDERETRQLQGNVHRQLQHAQDQGRMDGGLAMQGVPSVLREGRAAFREWSRASGSGGAGGRRAGRAQSDGLSPAGEGACAPDVGGGR